MLDMTLSELRDFCEKAKCEDCPFNAKTSSRDFYNSNDGCIFMIRPYDWKIECKKVSCIVINEDKKEIAEKIGELVNEILEYKNKRR